MNRSLTLSPVSEDKLKRTLEWYQDIQVDYYKLKASSELDELELSPIWNLKPQEVGGH